LAFQPFVTDDLIEKITFHVKSAIFLSVPTRCVSRITCKSFWQIYVSGRQWFICTPSNLRRRGSVPCTQKLPSFACRFCCDSHGRYIDLDLYKSAYVVGTLKNLKPVHT